MALILYIDTAVDTASVCLAKDGRMAALEKNENPKDHAAWLQSAIGTMMGDSGFMIREVEAIAVSIGPGSFTGLRVGLSSVKGLCYGLKIPMLTVGTLKMMVYAAKNETGNLLCPMIDARRMEVFTAVYDRSLKEIMKPRAMIVGEKSFSDLLASNKITFFGNGSRKFENISHHGNAVFKTIAADASHMIVDAEKLYSLKSFANLAYTEPLYLKEFYSRPR